MKTTVRIESSRFNHPVKRYFEKPDLVDRAKSVIDTLVLIIRNTAFRPTAAAIMAFALVNSGCLNVTPSEFDRANHQLEAESTPVVYSETVVETEAPAPAEEPAQPEYSDALLSAKSAHQQGNLELARSHYAAVLTNLESPREEVELARLGLRACNKELVFSRAASTGTTLHSVEWGQTLGGIANSYGTTSEFIRKINGVTGDNIRAGQKLKVVEGVTRVEVFKAAHVLNLWKGETLLDQFDVGCGRSNSTPVGTFVIETKRPQPAWWHDGRNIPYGDPRNPLGERWLGFVDTPEHQGYGIHGTSDPASIGKDESNGCVRLKNEDVIALYDLVPHRCQVTISE
ncbi:MAG: L,D-transpeptidase family protein [Planctomycetes bacterium]|nr:L,D-transpeptidase family protein [Planctomycetota bacterium]